MLKKNENITISYTHLYKTLSEAGLITKTRKKTHRKRRERKPEIVPLKHKIKRQVAKAQRLAAIC